MNYKYFFILLTLILPSLILTAQESVTYQWSADPGLHSLTEAEQTSRAVILKDYRSLEYTYEGEEQNLVMFYTEHKIIHVNEDAAVEDYNKFFIPLYGNIELIDIQARTVSPEGVVITLDRERIKEVENLENAGVFRLFAVEGLQTGGEVEYWYAVKRYPRFFGREVFQDNVPVRQAEFRLVSPVNLAFESRSYNGFPQAKDSLHEFTRMLISTSENLPPKYSERYASYTKHLGRVEYKLEGNLFNGASEIFNYGEATARYMRLVYAFEKQELKSAAKKVSELGIKKFKGEKRIAAIERFIKSRIALQEGNSSDFENVSQILDNKYGSELGIVRLYAALFREAGIRHDLVLGTDRQRFPLDPEWETWNYLDEMFFYFPQSDKYLAPGPYDFRFGTIPFQWTDTYALHIDPESVSDEINAVPEYKLKYIPDPKVDDHYDNIEIAVSFPDDFSQTNLVVSREMAGYRAAFIQPYFERLADDVRNEVAESILKSSGEDARIESSKISNGTEEDIYAGRPFIIEGSLATNALLEKAGRKYLFKLGDIIGPQVEMYQERERQLEIDVEYPHKYIRRISVTIPSGYVVKGLEDIVMDIKYNDPAGNPLMGFISNYSLDGNSLVVTINEYYNSSRIDAVYWEEFRRVINAAADFNKVVLLFEK